MISTLELVSGDDAYETVRDDVVLLQYWRGHLGMLVVVVLDESLVADSWLFTDEDGCFDDLTEACC